MSVSRRDGDLIMGLINIILFLAFNAPMGLWMPATVDVLLKCSEYSCCTF